MIYRGYKQTICCSNSNANRPQGVARRPLLIPLNINLDTEAAWVEQTRDLFDQLGFDLDVSGKQSILLRRTPVLLERMDFKRLVPAWLDELTRQPSPEPEMMLQNLTRLAPRFMVEPWTALDLNPLLSRLAERGNPLAHPAVALLDHATLASLFRS